MINDNSRIFNDIKTIISQFIDISVKQDKIIEQIIEGNQNIIKSFNTIDQKIDELTLLNTNNREHYSENDTIEETKDFANFNMINKTITFKGKSYQFNKEQLCSDSQGIREALNYLNQRKNIDEYPQTFEYCQKILNDQIKFKTDVLILTNTTEKPNICFYFIITDYNELSYSQAWRVSGTKLLLKQLSKLRDYKTDNYPQTFDFCSNILNGQIKNNQSIFILARNDGDQWTRYYFKSQSICLPSQNEELYISEGKENLKNELKLIHESENDEFPQGMDYIHELFDRQISVNGQILVIGQHQVNKANNSWFYFPPEQFKLACNAEWKIRDDPDRLKKEIEVIEEGSLNPRTNYPQSAAKCIKIVKEIIKKGGVAHIMVRNSSKNSWFFLKE